MITTKKRIISFVLAALMTLCTFSFAGCDKSELEYLEAVAKFSSNTAYGGKVNMEIAINPEFFGQLLELGEPVPLSKVGISADMYVDVDSFYEYFKGEVYVDDYKLHFEAGVDAQNKKIMVSSDTINGVIDALIALMAITSDKDDQASALKIEIVKNMFAEYIGDAKYFAITPETFASTEDGDETAQMFSQLFDMLTKSYDKESIEKLTAATIDFLKNAFDGYSTGMITGSLKDGFKIEADVDDIIDMVIEIVDYAAQNRDKLCTETDKFLANCEEFVKSYVEALATHEEKAQLEEAMKQEMPKMSEVFPTAEEIAEFSKQMKEFVQTPDFVTVKHMFEGSKFTDEVNFGDNTYEENVKLDILYAGAPIASLTVEQTADYTANKPELSETEKLINVEELEAFADRYLNTKYPVETAEIRWDKEYYEDGTTDGYTDFYRKEIGYDDYVDSTVINIDGRVYLPMRAISEGLGYGVEWDAENKKAYVINGVEKVDMTGIIHKDRTYIKVRDFEKLGCMVDYEEYEGNYLEDYGYTKEAAVAEGYVYEDYNYTSCTATVTKPGVAVTQKTNAAA